MQNVSLGDNLHEMSNLFSGKNKKNIVILSSAEFAQSYSRWHFKIYFLFFPENKLWYFMQFCLQSMKYQSLFMGKKNKKMLSLCCLLNLHSAWSVLIQSAAEYVQVIKNGWYYDTKISFPLKYWKMAVVLFMNRRTDIKKFNSVCKIKLAKICKLSPLYYHIELVILTLVLLNPDISYICKQCRSRSVGFWRSQLIWICTVCH